MLPSTEPGTVWGTDGGGVGDFYYTPPTGFLALCTKNLPAVAVVPSEAFNVVLYTGTGSAQSITGVGFQPDFTWLKNRNLSGGYQHVVYDARPAGTTGAPSGRDSAIPKC